jgi:hypothetical protein
LRFYSVKGLLRLDHCFVKPKNEDAEVIEVDVGGEKKKIVMAPGIVTVFQTVCLIRIGCKDVPDPGFPITLNRCIF